MKETIFLKSFCRIVRKELKQSQNPKLKKLTIQDLVDLFEIVFVVLAKCLKNGTGVIFNRFISVTTKPIKKNLRTSDGSYKWTYDLRIRLRPLPLFRKLAETNLTEEEYEQFKKEDKKEEAL